MVALCSSGSLINKHVEPESVFSIKALQAGRDNNYPYAYSKYDQYNGDQINHVNESLKNIGLSPITLQNKITVVIPSEELIDLPANLITINGEICGLVRPMAMTPSISWLKMAHDTPDNQQGDRIAWILPGGQSDSTLSVLYENLRPILNTNKFSVYNKHLPLHSLKESNSTDICIVGGHGGLGFGDSSFGKIVGEDGSHFSMQQLADIIGGARVIIMLICSAGRNDIDKFSKRTVGLPFMLLSQGTKTVIASPWPIDAVRASHWCEYFFHYWKESTTIAEAVFKANNEMAKKYSYSMDALAMHVYGDPLVVPID